MLQKEDAYSESPVRVPFTQMPVMYERHNGIFSLEHDGYMCGLRGAVGLSDWRQNPLGGIS
jgi:hypothetical protein